VLLAPAEAAPDELTRAFAVKHALASGSLELVALAHREEALPA
jgi:hypothetical protein